MLSQPRSLPATHSRGDSALRLGLGVSPTQNGTALLALRHPGAPGRERSSRKLRSAPALNRHQLCQRNGQGSGQDRQREWVGSPCVSGVADSLGCLSGLAGWGSRYCHSPQAWAVASALWTQESPPPGRPSYVGAMVTSGPESPLSHARGSRVAEGSGAQPALAGGP